MSDKHESDEGVTWKVAAQVCWALTWRVTALGAIVGTVDSVVLGKVLPPETNELIFILTSVPAMVWSVRRSLSVNYGSFAITVNRK